MARAAYAYDLERFDAKPKKQEKTRPELRVVKNQGAVRRAANYALALKIIAMSSIVVVVLSWILYNNVVLSELTKEINTAKTGLAAMDSDYQRLSSLLEGQVSVRNIEEQATQKMGLVKVGQSQVEYVDLHKGDWIELTEASPKPSLLDRVSGAIYKMLEYMGIG